ncbi:MAG: carbohydrate ABC transporter permease [Spirochaetaceae bacterium]|nr:carbohydrate ABC transporter permease [Spirochaetaceae bacterium]
MAESRQDKGWKHRVSIVALLIITIIYMIPLFYIVNTSFRPWNDIKEYPPKLIYEPSVGSYIRIFTARSVLPAGVKLSEEEIAEMTWAEKIVLRDTNERITRVGDLSKRYMNSIIISVSATILTVIMGTLTAYGFSRFKVPGEGNWLFFILSTRMLPPVVVVIPIFLMYRAIGLNDSHLGLILLYTAFNVSFAVWVLKGFIDEIPREYEEAAMVDGYTRWEVFRKVVLPQSVTGIAATAVFVFIFSWNEYAFSFLLTRNNAQTVPAWLPYQTGVLGYDWGAAAGGSVLFLLPAMILTILLRKHLVRGISFGAIRK